MKSLKDAATLLILITLLVSVRVTPPEQGDGLVPDTHAETAAAAAPTSPVAASVLPWTGAVTVGDAREPRAKIDLCGPMLLEVETDMEVHAGHEAQQLIIIDLGETEKPLVAKHVRPCPST